VADRDRENLGDMQSELKPSEDIDVFVSWGAKNNAYRVIANEGERTM
jgi:hypothetical protein